ncbi:MAG: NADH-quinone oxidoreductase subunit L [Pseudomonadota bacterium]
METMIFFAPLIGALIAGFGWRVIGEAAAQWVATGLLLLAAALSWIVFLTFEGPTEQIQLMRFIESGTLSTDWSIRLDRLTAIMLVVVTSVSALVHLYSFGYMAQDQNFGPKDDYKGRFFAYLSFLTFVMLLLVTADNLAQLFVGWAGVGFASYLLIGFYYKKPAANAAAIKALVVNRVADIGFALGIFALFLMTDSIRFDDIFDQAPELAAQQMTFLWADWNAANVIAVLLFIGAMGKSGQLVLHTWLPDTVEGPTPVCALLHAATIVTAGVFLVCRMSPLYEFAPQAMAFMAVIGASTALFAASIALVQTDIKRVVAYLTCAQMGFMFVAAGVGMYSAAMFHLFTQAFFLALLFLGAGSVLHAMQHERDMRSFGGLRHKLPYTFWAMMIGTLAITGAGIPLTNIGFAGFVSRNAVIESAFAGGSLYGFWLLVIAAGLISFGTWRLMLLTFFGQPRGSKKNLEHTHESPFIMLLPLGALAFAAVFVGMIWSNSFVGEHEDLAAFYEIPLASGAEPETAEDAARDATSEDAQRADESLEYSEKMRAFGGAPGAGALYFGPENDVLAKVQEVSNAVKLAPFVAMLIGLFCALWGYILRPDVPKKLVAQQESLHRFLLNKCHIDDLYDAVLVRPAKALGRFLWHRGDGAVIDGTINGVALGAVPFLTRLAGRVQSGYVLTYAVAMVIGLVILIAWMSFVGGRN